MAERPRLDQPPAARRGAAVDAAETHRTIGDAGSAVVSCIGASTGVGRGGSLAARLPSSLSAD